MNGLALFAGIGGLELGLKRALGQTYRTVCYVERDAYAASVLATEMGKGALDPGPIWNDVTTFRGRPWRGVVDIVSAGFPCQPWSLAGKRAGHSDERWLWGEIERIIGEVGPSYVMLENVAGLVIGGGLASVLGSLAALGYDAEWLSLTAAAVGAPHRRERVFILGWRRGLAHAGCIGEDGLQPERISRSGETSLAGGEGTLMVNPPGQREGAVQLQGRYESPDGAKHIGYKGGKGPVGDCEKTECQHSGGTRAWREGHPNTSGTVGNSQIPGLERPQPTGNPSTGGRAAEPGVPLWPPGPLELDRWAELLAVRPDLAPAVAPAKSSVRGVDHGVPNRVDRLRGLGNAVVPAQAEAAFRDLWRRMRA